MAKQNDTGKDWELLADYEDDLAGFNGCYSNNYIKTYHKHHNKTTKED